MAMLDTRRLTDDLMAAGIEPAHARAFAAKMEEAAQSIRNDLATKGDIQNLELRMLAKFDQQFSRFLMAAVAIAGASIAVAKLIP